jgi:hypothetical protein
LVCNALFKTPIEKPGVAEFEKWKKINETNLKRVFRGLLLPSRRRDLTKTHVAYLVVEPVEDNANAPFKITSYQAVPNEFSMTTSMMSVQTRACAVMPTGKEARLGEPQLLIGIINATLPNPQRTQYIKAMPQQFVNVSYEEIPLDMTVMLINEHVNAGLKKKDRFHMTTGEMKMSERDYQALLATVTAQGHVLPAALARCADGDEDGDEEGWETASDDSNNSGGGSGSGDEEEEDEDGTN